MVTRASDADDVVAEVGDDTRAVLLLPPLLSLLCSSSQRDSLTTAPKVVMGSTRQMISWEKFDQTIWR